MTTFLLTALVFLLAMFGLGIGLVLVGRAPRGSCGGTVGSDCAGCMKPCKKGDGA